MSECDHSAAQLDHQKQHGTEVVFWIACTDCDGFWTLAGDLDRETAHISQKDWEEESTGGAADV